MIQTRLKITGQEHVKMRLRELRKSIPEAVMVGVYALAEKVMDDAVDRTPVDTGDLRDSAYISTPEVDAQTTVMAMGFGAEHAIFVHEDTTVSHTTGEAKFLEKAMLTIGKGSLHKIVRIAERAVVRGTTWSQGRYPTRPKS